MVNINGQAVEHQISRGSENQLSGTQRLPKPNFEIKAGDLVFIPARPEWGMVEVVDASDSGLVSVRLCTRRNAPIVNVGRSAIQVQAGSEALPTISREKSVRPEIQSKVGAEAVDRPINGPMNQSSNSTLQPSVHYRSNPNDDSVTNQLLRGIRLAHASSEGLASILAQIEMLPSTGIWSNELHLGYALGLQDEPHAKRLAIIRLEYAFQLSESALPNSASSIDRMRSRVSDRYDIACLIGRLALDGLTKQDLETRKELVEIGLKYLKLVYEGTDLFYPSLHLYPKTLYQRGDYTDAAEIALELHRRAGIAYGHIPYDRWYWEYRMPRMTATKSFRTIANRLRHNGQIQKAIEVLSRMLSLGLASDNDQVSLERLRGVRETTPSLIHRPVTSNRSGHLRSALAERLHTILNEQGEATHYSMLVDLYAERHGNISAREICDILNARPQLFREVASGTYGLVNQIPEEKHWLLDLLSEMSDTDTGEQHSGRAQ